jgi:hypothetical protein
VGGSSRLAIFDRQRQIVSEMLPRVKNPTLESYRGTLPPARVAYIYGSQKPRSFLFHESAIAAFYITLDALNRFQDIAAIGGNTYVIPALGLWFLATESYVSTIYKVAVSDYALAQRGSSPTKSPKPPETNKLAQKYKAIEDYLMAPTPRPTAPISALREFATLRNAIFHDLTGVRRPTFHHTLFPSEVENVNEVDLMQGMIVSIDVFTYFRNLFPQTDMMPSIQIGFTFDKLDTLAAEVVFPAFEEILNAKGLTTGLKLHLANNRIAATAPLPLQIIMKTNGPQAPISSTIGEQIANRYRREAIDRRPVQEGTFHVPNYVR